MRHYPAFLTSNYYRELEFFLRYKEVTCDIVLEHPCVVWYAIAFACDRSVLQDWDCGSMKCEEPNDVMAILELYVGAHRCCDS